MVSVAAKFPDPLAIISLSYGLLVVSSYRKRKGTGFAEAFVEACEVMTP